MMTLEEAKFMVTHPESVRREDIDKALAEGREWDAANIVQMIADQLVNSGSLDMESWELIAITCEDVKDA